ncbi:MAG: hypothetical protein SGILL_007959, partial [Bacillariaceae sp.]
KQQQTAVSQEKMPKLNQNSTRGEYVTDVTSEDVLFGRGSGPNDHEGNIQFRELVATRKQEYMATNHRQTKATIAKDIVDAVFSAGGRFLKKLEPNEALKLNLVTEDNMHSVDYYQVVGDDTIMEKAKQALRQNRNREDHSPKPPGSASAAARTPVQSNTGGVSAQFQNMANHQFSPPLLSGSGGNNFDGAYPNHNNMQSHHQHQFNSHLRGGDPTPVMSTSEQQAMLAALQQQAAGLGGGFSSSGGSLNSNTTNPLASGIGGVNLPGNQQQQPNPMFSMDREGYATYTTTLDDPEDAHYFPGQPQHAHAQQQQQQQQQQQTFNRRQFMEMAGAQGNSSRRAGMLGGRKESGGSGGAGGITNATANVGKRESLHLDEIFHPSTQRPSLGGTAAQSMQMSELMESFKGMSTTEFNSSDDTIGTIDNLGNSVLGANAMSLAHMSGISQMSMNMSTDSMFKSSSVAGSSKHSSMSSSGSTPQRRKETSSAEESDKGPGGGANTAPSNPAGVLPPAPSTTQKVSTPNSKQSHGSSVGDASLGSSDFWKSDQLNSLMQGSMVGSSSNVFDHSHDYSGGAGGHSPNFRSPTTRLSITSETSANNDSSIPNQGSYEGQILPPGQQRKE